MTGSCHCALVRPLRAAVHLQHLRAVFAAQGGTVPGAGAAPGRAATCPSNDCFAANHAAEVDPGSLARTPPLDPAAQRSSVSDMLSDTERGETGPDSLQRNTR